MRKGLRTARAYSSGKAQQYKICKKRKELGLDKTPGGQSKGAKKAN